MKLPCPQCGSPTRVRETRMWKKGCIIRRRRVCSKGHRFSTVELATESAKKILRGPLPEAYKTQSVGVERDK